VRITEQIGSSFEANVPATDGDADFASMDKAEVEQRLVVVCQAAREVILKFIKTDDHLAPYPGHIQIPSDFFLQKKGAGKFKKMGKAELAKERKMANEEVRTREPRAKRVGGGPPLRSRSLPLALVRSRSLPP
jgi:hypothetical protein